MNRKFAIISLIILGVLYLSTIVLGFMGLTSIFLTFLAASAVISLVFYFVLLGKKRIEQEEAMSKDESEK